MNEANSIRAARLVVPFPAKAFGVTSTAGASVAGTALPPAPDPSGSPARVAEVAAPASRPQSAPTAKQAPAALDEATFSSAALKLAERAAALESKAVSEERFEKVARIRAAIVDGTYDEESKLDAIVDRVLNDLLGS